MKELYEHTVSRATEARQTLMGKVSISGNASASGSKNDTQNVDNDRKRRAQAAAERKAKVMAQMNQMQKKFAKTHQSELASMDTSESSKMNDSSTTSQNPVGIHFKAVGAEKSMPEFENKIHTCILCQEDGDTEDSSNTLVFTTYIVNSTVLSQIHPIDPDLAGKHVSQGFLPSNLKCGPTVTSCGHVMHAKCYQTMFDNLVKQVEE